MTSQTSHQPSDLTKGQVEDSRESCGTLKSLPGTCGQVCPSPWGRQSRVLSAGLTTQDGAGVWEEEAKALSGCVLIFTFLTACVWKYPGWTGPRCDPCGHPPALVQASVSPPPPHPLALLFALEASPWSGRNTELGGKRPKHKGRLPGVTCHLPLLGQAQIPFASGAASPESRPRLVPPRTWAVSGASPLCRDLTRTHGEVRLSSRVT